MCVCVSVDCRRKQKYLDVHRENIQTPHTHVHPTGTVLVRGQHSEAGNLQLQMEGRGGRQEMGISLGNIGMVWLPGEAGSCSEPAATDHRFKKENKKKKHAMA